MQLYLRSWSAGSSRCGRGLATTGLLLILVALLAGCSSPNRGRWAGTFDGSVVGVVEFEINARGNALEGEMEGQTADGQPFTATLEGRIEDPYFYAKFSGTSRTAVYPIKFEGLMRGEIAAGVATGDWTCTLVPTDVELQGTWTTTQQPEE